MAIFLATAIRGISGAFCSLQLGQPINDSQGWGSNDKMKAWMVLRDCFQ